MSTRIRLQRFGRKKRPVYRIVVCEKRSKRDGKALAVIGLNDPTTTPETLKIDQKELAKWQKQGAKTSEAVRKLLELRVKNKEL